MCVLIIAEFIYTYVVVYTDLSGKELHGQVRCGYSGVTSWSLGGVRVCTLTQNARDLALIPALGTLFPIFITPMTHAYIYIYTHIYTHKYIRDA